MATALTSFGDNFDVDNNIMDNDDRLIHSVYMLMVGVLHWNPWASYYQCH